jgi:predicted MFS family arabinose efflux permease
VPAASRSDQRGLIVLALGTFLCVTLANLPVGLLPQIAGELHVSLAASGLLMVGYAATATLSAVPLARFTAGYERRALMMLILADLCLSNLLGALAPSFPILVVSRLSGGLAHGLFWSIAAPLAGRLVEVGRHGHAISIMFLGNAVASVAGIPLATLLGQQAGWRATFLVAGVASGLVMATAWRALPRLPGIAQGRTVGLLELLRGSALRRVALAAFLAFTAQFVLYTYFTAFVEDVSGFGSATISPLLLVYGVMGIAGNTLAGRTVDRNAGGTAAAFVGLLAAVLAALALLGTLPWATVPLIGVWGAALAGLGVAIQTRNLQLAPLHAHDAASALNVVACNAGIGLGTLLGGFLIGGLGARALAAVGAAIALAATLALVAPKARH